jgi:hypothetical protein
MTNSHDFPAEFPPHPDHDARPLRWAIEIIVLTALALAVLNAEAIANWTQELPAGPRTAKALTAADAWNARTAELGLDAPQKALHRAWKSAKAMRWPDVVCEN